MTSAFSFEISATDGTARTGMIRTPRGDHGDLPLEVHERLEDARDAAERRPRGRATASPHKRANRHTHPHRDGNTRSHADQPADIYPRTGMVPDDRSGLGRAEISIRRSGQ